jgi:hypothetical protein
VNTTTVILQSVLSGRQVRARLVSRLGESSASTVKGLAHVNTSVPLYSCA